MIIANVPHPILLLDYKKRSPGNWVRVKEGKHELVEIANPLSHRGMNWYVIKNSLGVVTSVGTTMECFANLAKITKVEVNDNGA